MSIADSVRGFWTARTTRERAVLISGTFALITFCVFELAWRPMLHDLERLDEQLPRLRAEVAQLRQAADELPGLKQKAIVRVVDPSKLRAILQRTAIDRGLNVSTMREVGSRIGVTIESASFASWTDWVDDLHRRHGIVVVSVRVVALDAPGMVKIDSTFGPPGVSPS